MYAEWSFTMRSKLMKYLTMCVCAMMCLGAMACGKQKVEEEEVKEVSTTPPPKDDVVEEKSSDMLMLKAFKLYDATNPVQAIEMNEQGAIMVSGAEVAVLHADGSLKRDGAVLAKLNEDGTVTFSGTPDFTMSIDADGVATMSGSDARIYFAEDGSLVGQNESAPKMASEGCTGEVARTCVFVLLVSSMPMPDTSTMPESLP